MTVNYRQLYAKHERQKEQLLKLNPLLNDDPGIYFLTRKDENGIGYFYIGQAKHILSRLVGHMNGFQHIDLSLKKRKLWSDDNPYGWKANAINYPEGMLDQMEQHWILEYTKSGYQCRYNKTSGGQGEGKEKINEYKPAKGYRDGIKQGKKSLARDLKGIIDKHLDVQLKPEKKNNKVSQKQEQKFWEMLDEGSYE